VIGPTTLDAINFIALGTPKSSDDGDVITENFTLYDGGLYEANGLAVYFTPVTSLLPNEYGVTESSVLQAGNCEGGCGSFCIDSEGYLVSTTALSIPFDELADKVTNQGEYVNERVKFYACPNYEQSVFGGGDYKIYSNGVYNPTECIPIYLGALSISFPFYNRLTGRTGVSRKAVSSSISRRMSGMRISNLGRSITSPPNDGACCSHMRTN
jgi:hypothetical protein